MKKTFILPIVASALLFSCGEEKAPEIEEVQTDAVEMETETEEEEVAEVFSGVEFDETQAVSTADMLAQFEGKTEMETTFEGEITQVCAKMGCWVNVAKPDGESFMVVFKDHGTIPVDTEAGTKVYLHGMAVQDTISVELQRHYLEDEGKTAEEAEAMVTEPKYDILFKADGLKFKEGEE